MRQAREAHASADGVRVRMPCSVRSHVRFLAMARWVPVERCACDRAGGERDELLARGSVRGPRRPAGLGPPSGRGPRRRSGSRQRRALGRERSGADPRAQGRGRGAAKGPRLRLRARQGANRRHAVHHVGEARRGGERWRRRHASASPHALRGRERQAVARSHALRGAGHEGGDPARHQGGSRGCRGRDGRAVEDPRVQPVRRSSCRSGESSKM